MKATGIVRRIDDLGRIVIPKEIRRTLRLHDGDPIEIFTSNQGEVMLKKYSPIGEFSEHAGEYAESASRILDSTVIITDTDHVIAVSGSTYKSMKNQRISDDIEHLLQEKKSTIVTDSDGQFMITANDDSSQNYHSKIIVPIISQGDLIGSVILLPNIHDDDNVLAEAALKTAEVGAEFLAHRFYN